MRRALDRLYLGAGILAGLCLVTILLLILAQIACRLLDIPLPGATDYAGYAMAAASFLALAYALRHGAHIRVELVLSSLASGPRRALELIATTIGTGLAWYFATYAARGAWTSWDLNDVSQGQDATPLWIPQLAMVTGVALLAIAMTDRLIMLWRGAEPTLASDPPTEG